MILHSIASKRKVVYMMNTNTAELVKYLTETFNTSDLGGTMRATYCWVTLPNGERKYFSDCQLKEANAFAQTLADTSKSTIVRYDVDGGRVWFYAGETTADGCR